MHLNVEGFLETLPIMGYGMLGIFTVMLILYFTITVLIKVCSGSNKE